MASSNLDKLITVRLVFKGSGQPLPWEPRDSDRLTDWRDTMSQKTAKLVCGEFWVPGKTYHSPLPAELSAWYAYCSDGGHCIVCCLEQDYCPDTDLTDYLVPVPVMTVLRGYSVKNGYAVASVPYSKDLGLLAPEEDAEF